MLPKAKYKAVIIGAGRIASQFDSPKSGNVLTHAHAFRKHAQVDLVGISDIDKTAAARAAERWSCRAYDDVDAMMKEVQPDIVSVCTPNSSHVGILSKIAPYKPKIVICEKPLATHLSDAQKIVRLYDRIGTPLLINYSRRFDRAMQKIQRAVTAGEYGDILCASGIYTKGIIHNGSHMIDLCRYLFGEVRNFITTSAVADYSAHDRSVSGCLEFERCKQFHLMAGDERAYSIFEIDILFEKRRVRLIDSGFYVSVQRVKSDSRYRGYQCLGRSVTEKTSLDRAMCALVDTAVLHLTQGKLLLSSGENAVKTQKICELLLTSKKFKKQYV